MKTTMKTILALAVVAFSTNVAVASDMPDGEKLYKKSCKMCHHLTKDKRAPSFKAMNSDAEALRSTIINGTKKGMPKFGNKYSAEQIDSLVAFIQAQKD